MKNTGMIRQVDQLGRIVIPKELRDMLGIQIKDSLEVFLDGESMVFRKYQPIDACMITGKVSDDNVSLADGFIVISKEVLEKVYKELRAKFD